MEIEKLYMFDNNMYAFLLLTILLVVVIIKKDIYDYSRKLFYRMIIFNMILLLIEILAWAFDGINTETAFFANYLFNCLLILFEPTMAAMWLTYVDYKIYRSKERLQKRIYYLYASIFSGLLLIINIFTPIAFRLNENNVYIRGDFLWLSLVFVFALTLYTIVLAYKNRKLLSDKMIAFVAIFALLPVLVSFIQLFVYGLILTWAVVALGVVFAYYLIEIAGNSKDYLTGLESRKKIEEVLRGKVESKKAFSVIMIDLDYFKKVNDRYGHKTGDETLIQFSTILKTVFGKENLVSRIGGDEFLIASNNIDINNVKEYKSLILEQLEKYTSFDILREVGVSFGAKIFEPNELLTVDSIMDQVDELMYIDKGINKGHTNLD
ncbi:MAG: GGDEF domain-containing protein [Bacilli bacterium]|nr:GGDEF domain-containing protein [Bacilli bacterium]